MCDPNEISSTTVWIISDVFASCINCPFSGELDGKILRVGHELFRHDERAHRRERVVVLSDHPVGAVPRIAASSTIRHVVLERVTEDVVTGAICRNMVGRSGHHHAKLTFPVDLFAAGRQANGFAVRDDDRRRLHEHVGIPPLVIRLALPDSRCARGSRQCIPRSGPTGRHRRSGHFRRMRTVIHGHIQHRRRIHDRRERFQALQIVDVCGATGAVERLGVLQNLANPRAHAGVVARDQILHVGRRGNLRGRAFQRGTRLCHVDHNGVFDDNADKRFTALLECAELEGCCALRVEARRDEDHRHRCACWNQSPHRVFPPAVMLFHSALSAISGSTRVARRAGT